MNFPEYRNIVPIDRPEFQIPFGKYQLRGDIVPADSKPRILCLHGAGKSTRDRSDFFRYPLAADGIASVAFDMIGHGETGGDIKTSSLKERTEQAQAVIAGLKMQERFTLVGGSMSGYTVIKLTELYSVENLILGAGSVRSASLRSTF